MKRKTEISKLYFGTVLDKMCFCIFHYCDRQASLLLDYCQLQSAGNICSVTVKEKHSASNAQQAQWFCSVASRTKLWLHWAAPRCECV